MTSTRYTSAKAARQRPVESLHRPTSPVDLFLAAQHAQCQAMLAWQESFATYGKDFWEQWAVRYAGGMPFDG